MEVEEENQINEKFEDYQDALDYCLFYCDKLTFNEKPPGVLDMKTCPVATWRFLGLSRLASSIISLHHLRMTPAVEATAT